MRLLINNRHNIFSIYFSLPLIEARRHPREGGACPPHSTSLIPEPQTKVQAGAVPQRVVLCAGKDVQLLAATGDK